MDLNKYQETALNRFGRWLDTLNVERGTSEAMADLLRQAGYDAQDTGNYPKKSWAAMASRKDVPNESYVDREDGASRPIPHICFKIPTGGGKTLMAAAVLERLSLRTGLVLWVVPTDQIYRQTEDALKRRDGPIRQRLEHGSGGRVKIVQKDGGLSKHDIEQHLCVMPLMLAAANRSKNKDFLRMNRNSSKYDTLFPDVDDASGNASMLKDHPDLEQESGMAMHSLANVFRMLRPVVILDEAHKAYRGGGQEYAGIINKFNPSMVVEMSATPNPNISNLLVDVSGNDLWNEEMIKMPIHLNIQTDPDWKHLLDTVHARLRQLEDDAKSLQSRTEIYIRPIALVRVERTGRNQRDGRHIHAEDAKEYLMNKLAVPPSHIAVQSSEKKELEGVDLSSEVTQVRWIITKDAIKEGWDCPFAYALAILDNIKTHTSVTQLLGRVLRQPSARRTGTESLDRCYVYCYSPDTGAMAKHVKKGLSEAGMSDMAWTVKSIIPEREARSIEKHLKRPGPTFLPSVLHKDGNGWTELEYERHILSEVNFDAISAPEPSDFNPDPQGWKRLAVNSDGGVSDTSELEAHSAKTASVADFARPLSDIVPNVWQAARIVQNFMDKLRDSKKTETDIYNGMSYLVKVLRDHVTEAVNSQAERAFRGKVKRGNIQFDLEIGDGNYQVRNYTTVEGKLLSVDGQPVRRSLFEPVYEEDFDTNLERSFAKYLDGKEMVDWWHRVAARQSDSYHLMGWKKSRIYPDFVVMTNRAGDKVRMGIYDTKSEYLDNLDTKYKGEVLKTLEDAFNCGKVTIRGSRIRGEFRLVFEGKFEEILS